MARHWSKFEKMKALAAFEALNGDVVMVSEYTGIPVSTLNGWTQQPWWRQELQDSAPLRDKRMSQMRLHVYDAAFGYVKRLMDPAVIEKMPLDKLAIAFGILIDKMLLLDREDAGGDAAGDVYARLVNKVFGPLMEDHNLQTRGE